MKGVICPVRGPGHYSMNNGDILHYLMHGKIWPSLYFRKLTLAAILRVGLKEARMDAGLTLKLWRWMGMAV